MYICQLVWKKINQEITVVYNQFLYWHKQKKWEALPPRRISKKKIETTNHCQNQPFGTKKSKKKVTHTYTSLSLVSKECKRLLWFPTIVYEVRKINEIKKIIHITVLFLLQQFILPVSIQYSAEKICTGSIKATKIWQNLPL